MIYVFILVSAAFVLGLVLSVFFRTVVNHPLLSVYYCVRDIRDYIVHRRWNELRTGELICYTALFGKGKTLSVVHYITDRYRRYNGRRIYDVGRKMWVTQKVHVISNVDLKIPFERFESLSQIVSAADRFRELDKVNNTLTCILVLGDEFSVQLNSRQFKSNIDPMFLNTLLTCRHHHITIVYDSQRFGHVDALLRQVTSYVVSCNKVWRVVISHKYDAWDLENAKDVSMVRPLASFGWFVRDRDFEAYDTLACVGNLAKSCAEGDMLSETEILALQSNQSAEFDLVQRPSRTLKKSRLKKRSA